MDLLLPEDETSSRSAISAWNDVILLLHQRQLQKESPAALPSASSRCSPDCDSVSLSLLERRAASRDAKSVIDLQHVASGDSRAALVRPRKGSWSISETQVAHVSSLFSPSPCLAPSLSATGALSHAPGTVCCHVGLGRKAAPPAAGQSS